MSEWGCVSGEGEECMCEVRMVEGDIILHVVLYVILILCMSL